MTPNALLHQTLRRFSVPFIIVGGDAVNYHGFRRDTEDTDVVWLRSPEAEQTLLQALTEVNAQYIGKEIDPLTRIERTYPVTLPFIQASHLMMLWTKHGFFDLFDYIPGFPNEDVRQLFDTSVEADGLCYASFAWLRKMKQAGGRVRI